MQSIHSSGWSEYGLCDGMNETKLTTRHVLNTRSPILFRLSPQSDMLSTINAVSRN
jgi:hypothetical protein